VDDIHMGITHVIRGDDHVDNTFNHLLLYEALGAAPPRFAHLPMLVNDAGKPYSKRDGAAFVGDFRERGYLPEALFNFLALLGWSPGDNREKMTRQEIIGAFTLERVSSSPARVNAEKLDWLNGRYLTEMPFERFKEMLEPEMRKAGLSLGALDDARLRHLIDVEKERIKTLADFVKQTKYFFQEVKYDEKAEKVLVKQGGREVLPEIRDRLITTADFSAQNITDTLKAFAKEKNLPMGKVAQPLRAATTGSIVSPPIGDTVEILGKERVVKRIDDVLIRWQGRSF